MRIPASPPPTTPAALAVGLGLLLGMGGCQPTPTDVTVLAAASLSDVLPTLSTPGLHCLYSFGASSLLVTQAMHGAPADILLTADLESQRPLEQSRHVVPQTALLNSVVLLVRPELAGRIKTVGDLARVPLRHLALCDPAVPIGHYARQALQQAGVDVSRLPVVTMSDVRAVVAVVDSGNADAGFVYRTDAAAAHTATVAAAVPGLRVRYGISVLRESPQAHQYLQDLQRADNQARLRQAGFEVP